MNIPFFRAITPSKSEESMSDKRRKNRLLFFGLVAALVLTCLVPSYGQEEWGAITGTVSDPTGSRVPSATVVVTERNTRLSRTVTTDSAGQYTVSPLRPGNYEINVTKAGFRNELRSGVVLTIQSTVRLDFGLQVGAAEETVTVTSAASMLESQTSSVGTLFNETSVNNLPLNGQNRPAGAVDARHNGRAER